MTALPADDTDQGKMVAIPGPADNSCEGTAQGLDTLEEMTDEETADQSGDEEQGSSAEQSSASKRKVIEEAAINALVELKMLESPKKPQKKAPVNFEDALGRTYNVPFHLCNTWSVSFDLPRSRIKKYKLTLYSGLTTV
jgi:hypothetical protein